MRALQIVLVAAALAACQSAPQPAARAWPFPEGVKAARVQGYELAYVDRGSGVPVVMVHGAGVDYRYWVSQMEPLSARYRPVALSLRHHFPEPWRGDSEYSIARHVEDLIAFVKHLGVGAVHLVGHSRGASIALMAAAREPSIARSLVFAEGGGGMPAFAPDDPADRARQASSWRSIDDKLARGETDAALEEFANLIGGPNGWRNTPEASRQFLRDNAWTLVALQRQQAVWPAFSCEDARRLTIPVLLVTGQNSPPRNRPLLQKVEACLQRAQWHTVPNASHSMVRMNPGDFASAVQVFIDGK